MLIQLIMLDKNKGDIMKKILNLFILFVVCLLPVVVDAKANLEFEKEFS